MVPKASHFKVGSADTTAAVLLQQASFQSTRVDVDGMVLLLKLTNVSQDENKTALAFILNPSSLHTPSHGSSSTSESPTMSPLSKADMGMADSGNEDNIDSDKRVEQLLATGNHHGKMRVRKSSICAQNDCPRAAVSRGRCVRHGGGSRCTYPNCTHGARLYNRCFHHGDCKLCKIAGCTSKAKRYGYCWSHGGGHICDAPGCSKVAAPGLLLGQRWWQSL
ncbi:Hypothetical protein PHPALM_14198 [Phytophthora palmivora]|uniref:WRKY19-like zinc finger domain-containing protein n=1 Tax=Phytophthora palmivora TaxID=4796 RepID=A0A2P4XVD0_9STRA|nr:Hypothetical protein PHPALM_14198 [Phytophthora palmivora]